MLARACVIAAFFSLAACQFVEPFIDALDNIGDVGALAGEDNGEFVEDLLDNIGDAGALAGEDNGFLDVENLGATAGLLGLALRGAAAVGGNNGVLGVGNVPAGLLGLALVGALAGGDNGVFGF